MIKAILFDLDMTLMDFLRLKKIASAEAASAMVGAGLKLDLQKAGEELYKFYLEYNIEADDTFDVFLKKNNAWDVKILAAGVNAYHRAKAAFLEPYPMVIPTLIKLVKQGIKLGIVTDAPPLKAYRRLDSMKLTDYFDVVITEAKKPSKSAFERALKELSLKPEEVLMVGDWPERDIDGAHEIGMKTCLARYGQHHELKKYKPDYEINRFDELLLLVEK